MNAPSINSISHNPQIRNPILQSVLIIVLLGLFGWFVVLPKSAKVSEEKQQLTAIQTQQRNLQADEEAINRLISKLESSTDDVKLVDEALPLTNRPTRIALLLEEYARSSGMIVASIDIDAVDANLSAGNKEALSQPYDSNRALTTTNVTVSVGGSIEQFKNFLTLLENSGRIIDVESFTVNSSESDVRYNLKLLTYAYEVK